MRVGPKNEQGFLWRRKFWTLCFVTGALVGVVVPTCKANEVTKAELYLADNKADAQGSTDTSLSVCDCNYWVRVRWRAGETSPNPPDSRDNDFHIEIWQPGESRGDGVKIWSKYNIGDIDPGWQQVVGEVNHPNALETGTHNIRAYVNRDDTSLWKRSNKCTVTVYGSCTQGYRYVWAEKGDANLVGVQATIKTRYGKLCCEPFGTNAAHSDAYVNIDFADANAPHGLRWGQTGYKKGRLVGSTNTYKCRYWETWGTKRYYNYDCDNPPAEGSFHTYCVEFDNSTGEWTFYQDGVPWDSKTDTFWVGKTCERAVWVGEIYNVEDDMPGTSSNRCNFTSCQYKKAGVGDANAGFVDPNSYHTSDANEWAWEHVSVTAFNIWDQEPL